MEVLTIKPVENVREALAIRTIRNECREFMTRDKRKIGITQQVNWFMRTYLPKKREGIVTAYLGYYEDKPVAYGMIRIEYGRPLLTGGLLEKYRGKGLGKQLFEYLTKEASIENNKYKSRSVFLEVLETNFVAKNLYIKLGFVEKDKANGIISMQKDWGEFD